MSDIFPESDITLNLQFGSSEEINILKGKFKDYIPILKSLISKSNLFLDEQVNYGKTSFNSKSITTFLENGKGIGVRWENDWNSLKFYIFTHPNWSNIEYYPIHIENEDNVLKCYSINDMDLELTHFNSNSLSISPNELLFLKNVNTSLKKIIEEVEEEYIQFKNNLNQDINQILNSLDKDKDGEVDLVDGDSFNRILNKNQQSIIGIEKNYIQKFVKISMYLKTKKTNTCKIFESLKKTKNKNELNELVNLLKNQIHTYELLVFHSINMITSLLESDLITFYEIEQCFDQLGVFNSNWENEVLFKLTDIGDGIKDLMYSINQMEYKIVSSIDNLTYVTQGSFENLSLSVNKQLNSIDSSIKFNNLLSGIQTYQMYKINQNTQRID
jgi:hypothetical protein